VRYPFTVAGDDEMLEAAIEVGADDCQVEGEEHVITCARTALQEVAAALLQKFGEPRSTRFAWRPRNTVAISGDPAHALVKMLSALDDLDDVQNVYSNFEVSDEELEKLAG
jgi:transcriptional/translational regulatory protein YebC/TACO1